MKAWIAGCVAFAATLGSGSVGSALKEEDTPQVKALRAMQKVIKDKDWGKLYTDFAHPHLREQLDLDKFKAFMNGPKGQPVADVFDEVLKAVDSKADKTVLLAQPQEKEGEYEFILVKLKNLPPAERKGRQWHLELGLDDGRWKLLDTD